MGGKITKTECILLVMATIFLLAVGSLYVRASAAAEGVDYTISTARQARESVTPEPVPPVDINTADETALQALNGVGPALAQRIIDYREEHGPFRSVDDLLEVKGIGEATLAGFRDRVTVAAEDSTDIPAKEADQ